MIDVDEIKEEVQVAVDEAMSMAESLSQSDFVAFLASGDYMEVLKDMGDSPYVIDYSMDLRYDVHRVRFLARYLNKNYKQTGFDYQGEDGIDDLSLEMMAYTHNWESIHFLKILLRLAQLAVGNGYQWKIDVPKTGKRDFINENVIKPLSNKGLSLGKIVKDSYSSYLRNSFAHSLYIIYEDKREIHLGCEGVKMSKSGNVPFDVFQSKFFKSAYLSYYLNEKLCEYRDLLLQQIGCGTNPPVLLPDGNKMVIVIQQEYPDLPARFRPYIEK